MRFKIVYTRIFEKEFKRLSAKHSSLKSDFKSFLEGLEKNPEQGTPLGANCFKIRLAVSSKGKGKSGGARVITCVRILEGSVYMVVIYDKSEKESISTKEIQNRIKPFSSS
jgi:mRNA-degrading endonuclease RelE of RelBE toxin-antitoxin system